jgi:hypothetical protein
MFIKGPAEQSGSEKREQYNKTRDFLPFHRPPGNGGLRAAASRANGSANFDPLDKCEGNLITQIAI